MQGCLAGALGEFPADFKEPGPELLWFPASGFRIFEPDRLGPGHDLGGHHDDMAPQLVGGEGREGQVRETAVFCVANPDFTACKSRWLTSRSASWPCSWFDAIAVYRCPSMSVISIWAPTCGISLRTMTGIPAGHEESRKSGPGLGLDCARQ